MNQRTSLSAVSGGIVKEPRPLDIARELKM